MPFIVLEGIDGSGKSSAGRAILLGMKRARAKVVNLREPGSTLLGERVRRILLSRATGDLTPWAEACLFTACRAELVKHRIAPALKLGKSVLLDRYFYSTIAYQGHGEGADPALLHRLNVSAVAGVMPDRVLLFDLDPEAALRRIARAKDRMESKGAAFLARVREGYLAQARIEPGRFRVVDAAKPAREVAKDAWAALEDLFSPR